MDSDAVAPHHKRDYGNVENSFMTHKNKLKQLLRRKSLVRGTFTLASGKVSDYYIDCKLTTLDPEGAVLTGYAVLELLEENGIQADAIGGPPIGAHPIVVAVAAVSFLRAKLEGKGKPLPAFLIREQHKSYGLQKQIEGVDLKTISKVVIIDEVCTTGKSTREALKAVEDAGLQVVAVMSLVDREEGGSESLRRDYTYLPIFTARELRQDDDLAAGEPRQAAVHRERLP
jgi:orotate phosphoribosyltransferase